MKELLIVKIGGHVIDDESELNFFLREFSEAGVRKILVHGGGRAATALSRELGIETRLIDGRRITDSDTIRIVTMVYGGLINKTICSRLQTLGCNALGLSGPDGAVIRAHKRQHPEIDYGYVGDIDQINTSTLEYLLEGGFTPVMAPLSFDEEGDILNTNADTIAAETASALAASYKVRLIYAFEKDGLLRNVNDDSSLIEQVSVSEDLLGLIEDRTVSEGMLPKIHNIRLAISHGVEQVILCKSSHVGRVLRGEESGTLFKA